MNFLHYVKQGLKEKGYKLTQPRISVIETLSKIKTPLNAYKITDIIKEKSSIDVSTVYRILELLKKLDLVHFISKKQGYVGCRDWDENHKDHCHHHFICKKCHIFYEIHLNDENFLKNLKNKLKDLEISDHYFEFSGLCKSCK